MQNFFNVNIVQLVIFENNQIIITPHMKSILTDTEYKQIIRRIATLSSLSAKVTDFEELKTLSALAMDYETRRYDFSLSYNSAAQNFSISQH